jgi:glutaredoxin
MLKKIIVFALVIYGGYFAWQKYMQHEAQLEPLYEKPYIIVYGRETCGWTQKYMEDLRTENLSFSYKSVDDENSAAELHSRMKQSGIDTSYYDLPVLDVNTKIMIRPEMDTIKAAMQSSQGDKK